MLLDYKGNLLAPPLSFTPLQKDMLLHLVANLEGEKDRTVEIETWKITPDIFPEDDFQLRAAKRIFQLYQYFRIEKIPPTRTNIIRYLAGNDQTWLEGKDLGSVVDEILQKKTYDRQVITIAAGLSDFIFKMKGVVAGKAIQEIYQNPNKPNIEAYDEAVSIIQQVQPSYRSRKTIGGSELMEKWRNQMRQNYDAHKSGKLLGPRFPWRSTWDYLPFMRKGDMTLLFAQLKFGKTTLVAAISEYVAYHLGGFDVLHVHLETSDIVMQSRMIARNLDLPINEMEQGWYRNERGEKIDIPLHEEPYLSRINEVDNWIREREETHGKIIYFYCPGATVSEIEAEVAKRVEESKARGRELLVVIDYYNRIRWQGIYKNISGEASGLNMVASELKDAVSSHDCFFLIVAQDDPDNDFSKDITVRGAKEIAVVGQVLCRVERKVVSEDEGMDSKVMADTGIKDAMGLPIREQRRDAIGRPMYYHRVGEFDSITTLNFVRGNNNRKGKAQIRMMNGYFFVDSVETKTVDLSK